MEPPYIGVSGAFTFRDTDNVLSAFADNGMDLASRHKPSLNILVSYKNLEFDKHPESRRHPPLSQVPVMLEKAKGRSLTAIHYNSRREDRLAEDVRKVFSTGNIYDKDLCKILQLNITRPPLEEVKTIKKEFPKMKIVYQLSGGAVGDMSKRDVVSMVGGYPVSYVLVDFSRGTGTELDIAEYSALCKKLSHLGKTLGVAGGLSGCNVRNVIRQFREVLGHDRFSVDAEGKLRNSFTDELWLPEVQSYVKEAAIGFRKP